MQKSNKKQDTKNPKTLTLSFSNILGIRINLCNAESFLLERSPDILDLCESNLNSSIPTTEFGLFSSWLSFFSFERTQLFTCMAWVPMFENIFSGKGTVTWVSRLVFHWYFQLSLNLASYLFFLYRSPSTQKWALKSTKTKIFTNESRERGPKWFHIYDIDNMSWPVCSPDFNSI